MASGDPLESDLVEVDAAIGLIAAGAATRVRLANLRRPEALAAIALARSREAGIRFTTERRGGSLALTFASPD